MALSKAVTTRFGVDATFWTIDSVNHVYRDRVRPTDAPGSGARVPYTRIVLAGWADAATSRKPGAEPLLTTPALLADEFFKADASRAEIFATLSKVPGQLEGAEIVAD